MPKEDICGDMRTKFELQDLDSATLNEADIAPMQAHFEICDSCKTWLTSWEVVRITAKHLADLPAPPDLVNNVMAQIQPEPATVSTSRETLFSVGCLLIALVFLANAGAESASEIMAWFASFALLFGAQRLLSTVKPSNMVSA